MQQIENVPFIMPTYQCYDDIQKYLGRIKLAPIFDSKI